MLRSAPPPSACIAFPISKVLVLLLCFWGYSIAPQCITSFYYIYWRHCAHGTVLEMHNGNLVLKVSIFPRCEHLLLWEFINSRLKQNIRDLLPWQWWAWWVLRSCFCFFRVLLLKHLLKGRADSLLEKRILNPRNFEQHANLFYFSGMHKRGDVLMSEVPANVMTGTVADTRSIVLSVKKGIIQCWFQNIIMSTCRLQEVILWFFLSWFSVGSQQKISLFMPTLQNGLDHFYQDVVSWGAGVNLSQCIPWKSQGFTALLLHPLSIFFSCTCSRQAWVTDTKKYYLAFVGLVFDLFILSLLLTV